MTPLKKTKAFTLVELLVVIGILAVLFSFLLPSLQKARVEAKRVQCMNNERQLLGALIMYTNDNNGTFPSDSDQSGNKGAIDNDCSPSNPFAVERNCWWYVDANGNAVEPAYLGKYLGAPSIPKPDRNAYWPSPAVVHCPDDQDQALVSVDGDQNGLWYGPISVGYGPGMNGRTSYWYPFSLICSPMAISIAAPHGANGLLKYSSVKISQAKYSSKKIAIIELHAFHDNVEAFPAYATSVFLKSPKYVAGFCDSHVEVINVEEMMDTDVNYTGRSTNGVPGWGIEGQDVY